MIYGNIRNVDSASLGAIVCETIALEQDTVEQLAVLKYAEFRLKLATSQKF